MTANTIARHYYTLTAEERFRLIVAAGSRGDQVEADRLKAAAKQRTILEPDHTPFARAFQEVAGLTFADLLDSAAEYLERYWQADTGVDDDPDQADQADDDQVDDCEPESGWVHRLELADAAGYILIAKAAGWCRFCDRLTVPPWILLEAKPGYPRLERALKLAESSAFTPDAMLDWLNRVGPEDAPPLPTERLVSAESYARDTESFFRDRVKYWTG